MNILIVFKLLAKLLSPFEGSFTFESLESKTTDNKAVYNKIHLVQKDQKDIWLMDQTHNGIEASNWDRIKIIVDKKEKPFKASYYQLQNNKEIPLKTDCYRCHANGPRLIRPKTIKSLNITEQLILLRYNSIIKSYGYIKTVGNFKKGKPLELKSCKKCHDNGSIRAELTDSHRNTALFLIKNKLMPPSLHEISDEDKQDLSKFLYGY